jgi:hypothetical protein
MLAELKQAVREYDEHLDVGRHGNPKGVAAHYGVPQHVLAKIHEGLQTDWVVGELERRKSDASLPEPETTRRDALDAAFLAHQIPDSN